MTAKKTEFIVTDLISKIFQRKTIMDKLPSQHVEYIFDVMSNTTQPIKNIMAYLRTTILNAPTTMEHYYQAQGNWLTAQSRKK